VIGVESKSTVLPCTLHLLVASTKVGLQGTSAKFIHCKYAYKYLVTWGILEITESFDSQFLGFTSGGNRYG
jgi:hypothetical protein